MRFRTEMLQNLHASAKGVYEKLEAEKKFTDEIETELKAAIERFKSEFAPTPEA